MTIDNIKNYLSEDKKDEFIEIINQIYKMTKNLNDTYPGYQEWFYDKQVKGCFTPSRNILFVKDENGEVIAFSCLKRTDEEKKICTLFVDPNYRKHGLGDLLLEASMEYLGTTKPLATFSADKLPMLDKIIKKYDWQLTEVVDDIYIKGVRELCYNGKLTKTHKK